MAIFQQTSPASLRFGSPAAPENRSIPAVDRRPYLVPVPSRRPAGLVRQAVGSTRQFFALFPHEPEDARITGTTRSLYRRLLALNLPPSRACDEGPSEARDVIELRFALADARIA